jgi:hypothetical protein
MRLEQLRKNDIGTNTAWIPSLGSDAMTHLTYIQFSHLAFYYSAQQIEQLEMSTAQINQGNATQTTVGLWFMAIESYISSLLRISCLVKHMAFDDYKKKALDSRIKVLFDLLKIDKIPFYSGPFQKLEEFKRYRNELFHDRTNDTALAFDKTSFGGNPFFANQVDVMQAAVVAMQIFHSFRYVIPRLDLMPQVMVTKGDSFFYEKADVLFSQVLSPYFQKSLSKHSLTSDVDLNINSPCLSESPIFSEFPIEVLVKAVPDEKYHATPSQENTRFGEELFGLIRDNITFDTKTTFKVANFYR